MSPLNRRHAVLGAAGVVLGLLLGSTFAARALSVYLFFPIPPSLLFAPVVGLLVYLWTDRIQELLGVLVVVSVVAIGVLVLAVSTPAFVLDATAAGRGALYRVGVFNAFVSILTAVPIVVLSAAFASVLDTELRLIEQYHLRGETTRRLLAVTIGITLLTTSVAGLAVVNYASVAEQSQAEVTVSGVDVDGDQLRVGVTVPNRLTGRMDVRSVVIEIQLNDSAPQRTSLLARETIAPGGEQTFVVRVEEPTATAYRNADSVRITGVVRVEAFNGYEAGLAVDPYTAE